MDPATSELIGSLNVLYIEDDGYGTHVVCSPLQPQLDDVIAAINSLDIVNQVTRSSEDSYTVLKITYDNQESLHPQRIRLCTAFKATYIFGTAKGQVERAEDGMHRDTILELTVALWAITSVLAKLSAVREIKQYFVSENRYASRSTATITFTLRSPTRDAERNRTAVAHIAEQLGIRLQNMSFPVEDDPKWAAMSGCNLPGDPIDQETTI